MTTNARSAPRLSVPLRRPRTRPARRPLTAPERDHLERLAKHSDGVRLERASGWHHRTLASLAELGLISLEHRPTVRQVGGVLLAVEGRWASITPAGRVALASAEVTVRVPA